ncbi:MAG: iron ABC transporter permease [Pseudomonadota bacterium]
MTRARLLGRIPALSALLIAGLLVTVFIAVPIGAMLIRSAVVAGPVPVAELKAMTEDALAFLPEEKRAERIAAWYARAKPRERMEAIAASLTIHDHPVGWDRKAAFDRQIEAAEAALAALEPAARSAVEADLPIAYVTLFKRVPLAFMVKDALDEAGFDALRSGEATRWGWDHYLRVVTEQRMRNAALNSLILATVTTALTLSLAFAIAYGINRGGVWRAEAARIGVLVPLVSPPVVVATAAILLLGRNGIVTKGVLDDGLGLIDAGVSNLYGFSGVLVAQVLSFLPAAFIVLDNVLSKSDGRLEEAAAAHGASAWQIFTRVTLPMAQPGLLRAATLIFLFAMTDFGNPQVIGKDMPVLAGVLYDEMVGFHNTSLSSAIAVWLIVPALSIALLLGRIGRRKRFDSADQAPSALPVPRGLRRGLTALTWGVIGITVVIYGTILAGSFVKVWGQDWAFTPHHYTSVDAVPGFVSSVVGITPVWTSLMVAGIAAPLGALIAVVIAWLAERRRGVAAESVALVTLVPAILPGVVFGIGYIVAFNAPFGIAALSLNGTHTILVLNILFGNMFVGVLAARAMLRRLDPSVEEAAESLGAGLVTRFTRITLPMMRRAAILGGLYVLIDGMCTFSAVVFLQGPDIDLASVEIFHAANVSYYGVACAMSVTILLVVLTVMAAQALIERLGPRWARAPALGRQA